jgi:CubicO group peptidase (beta-lactamase class C family)
MTKIAATLSALIDQGDAPAGAAALFVGNEVIWAGAQGPARPHVDPGKALTIDTKARVASISKVATALSLIQLAEQGRIDLDSDASPWLGFDLRHPGFPNSPITPRMILSHTSGVRDADDYRGLIGLDLSNYLVPTGSKFAGGKHWAKQDLPLGHFAYSNFGMGLIAQMVERITGQRFDLAAKALVFDPLGIDCGFNWSGVSAAKVEAGATLYRRRPADQDWTTQVDEAPQTLPLPTHATEPGKTLADYEIGSNGLCFSPQGGLRASVMDLVRIGKALTGALPLLEPAVRARISAPVWTYRAEPENGDTSGGAFQGFGTGVHRLIPGETCPVAGLKPIMIGHYGEAYGLLAGLWVDPQTTKGFAWFVTGSLFAPRKGRRSGVYALEEEMMQAACEDLGLIA